MTIKRTSPWLFAPWVEALFILCPPFLSVAFVAAYAHEARAVRLAEWVLLVICVDVAHVYSTLFRTYFDSEERKKHGRMLILIPVLGFALLLIASMLGSTVFWRVLAYIAVFHFVRQQYGFMRLYCRHEERQSWIDTMTIHMAAIFPLVYWHTHDRSFQWFVQGDFFRIQSTLLYQSTLAAYVALMVVYAAKESLQCIKHRTINLPKQGIVIGTALSWYFGIVYYDGDLAFTITNVISHGIPYMALVWLYGRKNATGNIAGVSLRRVFTVPLIPFFLGFLVLLGFVEEGLWDALFWNEHGSLFDPMHRIFLGIEMRNSVWLLPLLAVPQVTHYILDAFVWRVRGVSSNWKSVLHLE